VFVSENGWPTLQELELILPGVHSGPAVGSLAVQYWGYLRVHLWPSGLPLMWTLEEVHLHCPKRQAIKLQASFVGAQPVVDCIRSQFYKQR
jgi:hypothetical protein